MEKQKMKNSKLSSIINEAQKINEEHNFNTLKKFCESHMKSDKNLRTMMKEQKKELVEKKEKLTAKLDQIKSFKRHSAMDHRTQAEDYVIKQQQKESYIKKVKKDKL